MESGAVSCYDLCIDELSTHEHFRMILVIGDMVSAVSMLNPCGLVGPAKRCVFGAACL
jgi:hypothetical protein